MRYPLLEIESKKIEENAKRLIDECHDKGIQIAGVTKVFSGNKKIVKAIVDAGIDILADSRIENLKSFKDYKIPKMLIRIPMKSQIRDLVKYTDIALVSEIEIVKEINKFALKANKKYKVILMVDIGDLREGIFFENKDEIHSAIQEISKMKYVELYGLGTNLTCYGGIIPTSDNLSILVELKKEIEKKFGKQIKFISGGNSETIPLMRTGNMPEGINQLRLGASIALGIGLYDMPLENLYQDTVKLKSEIIEIKQKPSKPIGEISVDAFGNKPHFEDKGIRKRAICAIGKQDVNPEHLIPIDENIQILGASSDHLLLDTTDSCVDYKIGDTLEFKLTYGGLLSAMTSKYIYKRII
ncbi:hypothetical protein ABG79_01580 [Caloramator mitchellensis]|uniref:Alanine racemase N-terminal domain-containing protein n=1 Tax=Caloramator mitchellensis TaxID=908809 RepID=A0A0R3K0Z7_CALMK|nr:ornithine racemase Orr [Caloramator mitchellensis]KRQ86597.1 hypothetical protein ABG79_01580 [Caloramator mitchellensis]